MWITFSAKRKDELKKAVEILTCAFFKIKEEVKNGENTAYFTGGYSSREEHERANNNIDNDDSISNEI
jgi:hypothetical protein